MFTKPRDRDVVCHASAWDVTYDDDLRIKMCIKPTEEDLVTIHHELGHDYYFHALLQAADALPAAAPTTASTRRIGDTIALSMTPGVPEAARPARRRCPTNDKGRINLQMKDALDKVAFLPFGLLIDQWRWDVFSGKIDAGRLQQGAGGTLRQKYQGVAPPVGAHARRTSIRARSTTSPRTCRTRATSWRASSSSSSTARCARRPATRARCTSARSTATRRRAAAVEDARAGREQAVARGARGDDRAAADGRHRHPRVLRAAAGVARGAEQGPAVRLVRPG